MWGAGAGQCVDLSGRALPHPRVTGAMTLETVPHGGDDVAALQDKVVAQVEAEEIDDDRAAPTLVSTCSARYRDHAMETNQLLRVHIANTEGIHQEWPLQVVEPPDAGARLPTVPGDRKVVLLVVLVARLARHQIVETVVGKPRIATDQFVASIELIPKRRTFLWPTLGGTLRPEMLDIVLPSPTPIPCILATKTLLGPRQRALAVSALEALDSGKHVLDVAPSRLLATLCRGKPARLLCSYLSSQLATADPVADHRPEFRSARRLPVTGT